LTFLKHEHTGITHCTARHDATRLLYTHKQTLKRTKNHTDNRENVWRKND